MKLAFYPGAYVFPGGRVDAGDSLVPASEDLHPVTAAKLLLDMKGRPSARRARALGVAAIRETFEEAGILIGSKANMPAPDKLDPIWQPFAERGIAPNLSTLRYVFRAITPPHHVRRFDTRFFAVFADAVADALPEGKGPSQELDDVRWMTLQEARGIGLPWITQMFLQHLEDRLEADPRLDPGGPVSFIHVRRGQRMRELL